VAGFDVHQPVRRRVGCKSIAASEFFPTGAGGAYEDATRSAALDAVLPRLAKGNQRWCDGGIRSTIDTSVVDFRSRGPAFPRFPRFPKENSMTKLHGVRPHPFRRTLPRMPKASHLLWILAVGLLLLAVLTFWSHSAAADETVSETRHIKRLQAQPASCDSISVVARATAGAGSAQ
jgi:hypothetical protein